MKDWAAAAGVLAALCLPLMVTTARGARVRGAGAVAAALAGIGFPLTWTVWYVVDDAAGRSEHRSG